jgi:hypothetical protein
MASGKARRLHGSYAGRPGRIPGNLHGLSAFTLSEKLDGLHFVSMNALASKGAYRGHPRSSPVPQPSQAAALAFTSRQNPEKIVRSCKIHQ